MHIIKTVKLNNIRILIFIVLFLTDYIYSQITKGSLSFYVDKDNHISLIVDFELPSNSELSTSLMLIPFPIVTESIIHSDNCIVSSYKLGNNSLVFLRIIDPSYNISFTARKIARISSSGSNTMQEVIDFSLNMIDRKILDNIINSNSYISFQAFNYSVEFAPEINKNTAMVSPKMSGQFSDLKKNMESIIIQYTNPQEFANVIAQSLLSFMIAIVTLILTLFFVDLDKIRKSRNKTILFTIITSLFISINIIVTILLTLKVWENLLYPTLFFMSPNSIAFIFFIASLFRGKKQITNIQLTPAASDSE